MKKQILSFTLAAALLLAGGCVPDEFVWWSPDGQTAALRTSDGLRLAAPNGDLSAVVLPGEIQAAAWMPDGSSLVVSRSFQVPNWTAAENLIPLEEAQATMQLARALPDLLKAGLVASGGSWDTIEEKFFKPLGITESAALEPAWLCAISLYREQILAAFAGTADAAALQSELLSSETNGIPVHEISILSVAGGRPAGEPRALVRSLRPLLDPVLSPRHSVVAFRTGEGALKALTSDGKSSLVVAGEDVRSAVWSSNGRHLIYVIVGESDHLGEIRSRKVVSDSGELLADAPEAESLAMAAFAGNGPPTLAVLPDGRLIFASLPVTLPARPGAIQAAAQFFLLNPDEPEAPPTAVAIREGSLPGDLSAFAVSPDGLLVAVVESGTDAVAVLEISTGKVKIISPAHDGWKSRMIPAWRNALELTFARPSSTATRPELILWQANVPERTLSQDWPESVVAPWLEAPSTGGDPPASE